MKMDNVKQRPMTIRQMVYLVAISSVVVLVSCGSAWRSPPSWTIREDGILRRKLENGKKEELTIPQFIAKIKKEEAKSIGYALTPAGEAAISARMRQMEATISDLENKLRDCK